VRVELRRAEHDEGEQEGTGACGHGGLLAVERAL
jgi:hypothetical protein